MKLLSEVKGLFFVVLFALLAGCGGGGGGGGSSEPTPPPEPEFSLATLKSTDPGPVYSTPLSGTDLQGGQWTGSIAIINGEQVLQNGIMVTPQMQEGSLTSQQSGLTSSFTTTLYIDGNGVIQYRTDEGGVICTPAFPYELPDFVKIGDGEAQPKETCTDGLESDSSWRVEDAGGGNANFITAINSNDASTSEETITIDVDGNILAYEQVVSIDGDTLTLRSP